MTNPNGKKCKKHKWVIARTVSKRGKTFTFYECAKCYATKLKIK